MKALTYTQSLTLERTLQPESVWIVLGSTSTEREPAGLESKSAGKTIGSGEDAQQYSCIYVYLRGGQK